MKYKVFEARFGYGMWIVGMEPVEGLSTTDRLFPAWNIEAGALTYISEGDVDFWDRMESADPTNREIAIRTLGGDRAVQKLLEGLQ